MTFLVSKPVLKPKCQSHQCNIFGFETGFETKMSFSDLNDKLHLNDKLLKLNKVSISIARLQTDLESSNCHGSVIHLTRPELVCPGQQDWIVA